MSNRDMGPGEIMENGQMGGVPPQQNAQGQQNPQDDSEAQGNVEDMIINDFISQDMAFTTWMNEVDDSIPYNRLTVDTKANQDHKAFTYYNNLYVETIVDQDGAPNITLENFILLHNPSFEFRRDLTDFSLGSTDTDATDWESIYKNDLELHKKSAIKGYQNTLLAMASDPATVNAE